MTLGVILLFLASSRIEMKYQTGEENSGSLFYRGMDKIVIQHDRGLWLAS